MGKAPVNSKSINPVDRHIGLRIRSRRLALGKSQGWLGDQLGLTFQQVQKYEHGVNRVGGSRMVQIAGALQTEPSFFFEGAPSSDAATPATVNGKRISHDPLDGFLATRAGVELARAFVKIKNPDRKAQLVRIAEEFAANDSSRCAAPVHHRQWSTLMTAETTLELAIRHVRDGKRTIAGQRALIAKQKEGGHDTEAADSLLVQFERALMIFEDDLRALQDATKPN